MNMMTIFRADFYYSVALNEPESSKAKIFFLLISFIYCMRFVCQDTFCETRPEAQ